MFVSQSVCLSVDLTVLSATEQKITTTTTTTTNKKTVTQKKNDVRCVITNLSAACAKYERKTKKTQFFSVSKEGFWCEVYLILHLSMLTMSDYIWVCLRSMSE